MKKRRRPKRTKIPPSPTPLNCRVRKDEMTSGDETHYARHASMYVCLGPWLSEPVALVVMESIDPR